LRLLKKIWNYSGKARSALESALSHQRSLQAIDWSALSRTGLQRAMAQVTNMQLAHLPVAGLANSCSGPWQLALDALVKDADLIARLQTGAGGVASAEPGYRLYDVAQGKATLEEFLRDFGHHAVHEADFLNPRWAEDPSWILEQVQFIRANRATGNPRETAAEVRRQAERELRRRFGWRTPFVLWLVRKLRAAVSAREAAKSALICLGLPLRRIVLEIAVHGDNHLAARIVKAGSERGGLAKVAAQLNHHHPRIQSGDLFEQQKGAVRAGVIHKDDLKIPVLRLHRLHDLGEEGNEAVLLVVKRHDDGELGCHAQ